MERNDNVILPAKEFFDILNKTEQQTIQNAIMKINMDLRKHLECPKGHLFIYYPGNFGTDVSLHTMHIIKNLISSAGYYVTMSETQRDGLSMTIDLNKTLEILKRDGLVVGIGTKYDESCYALQMLNNDGLPYVDDGLMNIDCRINGEYLTYSVVDNKLTHHKRPVLTEYNDRGQIKGFKYVDDAEVKPVEYDIQVKGNSQPFVYKEVDGNGEKFEFIFDPGKTFKYTLDGVTYETYGVISVDGNNLTLICPKVGSDVDNKLRASGLKLALWMRELVKKDAIFDVKNVEMLKLPLQKECSAYVFLTHPVYNPLIHRWITTGTYEIPVKDYLIGQNPVYDKKEGRFWVKCLVSEHKEEDNIVLRAIYFDDSKELLLEIEANGIDVWTDSNTGAFQNYTFKDQNARLSGITSDNWREYSMNIDRNYYVFSADKEENSEK